MKVAVTSLRTPSFHPTVIVAETDAPEPSETPGSGKSFELASVGDVGSSVSVGIDALFDAAMYGTSPVLVVGPTVHIRSYFPVVVLHEPTTVIPLLWAKAEGARIAVTATTTPNATQPLFRFPNPSI